jgi:hypothetical protein
MRRGLVATAAIAVGFGLGLLGGAPAWAASTIDINPGNVPATAAGYSTIECDDNLGGGPFPNQDVWVFVLPGGKDTGEFISVTAVFSTPGGTVTLTIPTDGGEIVTDNGASKAWIATPAGWTLTGATAVVSGDADSFNLTHTCPASGGSPSPSGSPTPSESPSPSPSGSSSTGSTPPGSVSPTGPGAGPSLPRTGLALTGLATTGAALVAGGTVLLAVRRRREEPEFTAED